jgi:endoglucanase
MVANAEGALRITRRQLLSYALMQSFAQPSCSYRRSATTDTASADRGVTFRGVNGINIMWPFMGPTVVNPDDPNTAYSANPFLNPSSWSDHVPTRVLAALASESLDFVRICVAPGPWIDAVDDSTRTATLFGMLDVAVRSCLDAGLAVNIDMHDTYYVKNTPRQLLAGGVDGLLFQRRVMVTRSFAQHYATYSPEQVALELFNEPMDTGSINGDWLGYLNALYATARSAMPRHTLLLTMENWSDAGHLMRANPASYDANTLWVIHPYLPAVFVLQGYNGSDVGKYVSGLNWPPIPSEQPEVTARMVAAVSADESLTDAQKTALIRKTTKTIGWYYSLPEDEARLGLYLDQVVSWCGTNGIATNRIIANEYGVTRDNAAFRGAPTASRIAWMNAMTELLAERGFRKALFALDAVDFGVTDGTSSAIGTTLPGLKVV